MLDDNKRLFTVTDLKQFSYCARIVYYHGCLPDIRPTTYKMEAGIRRHEHEQKRALRRTMTIPDIDRAERHFDVPVQSTELGLSGQIDEVIVFEDHLIPVDYKLAKNVGQHFKLQLAAYAMMAEATFALPAPHGFLYLIPKRQSTEVTISKRLRQTVYDSLEQMRHLIDTEAMPQPTPYRQRCIDCEFRRFCNDV